ncbi:hypothetical protein CXP39_03255 [Mesoplasma syrphidae]|uniref:Uncharacterized protein n=1 Tax=Mesoplasma syrphidae TaxID=225999 RepID=A0A2K9BP26_9MOLU|nr:hypothetical protein [Mesoplasma syrphidae]AUF83793.1 hypothetical protein CXP39_03255 [Mesoplasma syrphidae]
MTKVNEFEVDLQKLEEEIKEVLLTCNCAEEEVSEINSFNLMGAKDSELVHAMANVTLASKTTNMLLIYSTVFKKLIYMKNID